MKKTIVKICSIASRVFLVIGVLCYMLLHIGGAIAKDNANQVSDYLGQNISNKIVDDSVDASEVDSQYHKSAYKSVSELKNNGEELTRRVMEEGAVLLKNDNDALPLDVSVDKVSLFSASSVNPVLTGYRETAEKSNNDDRVVNLKEGLESAGITVNEALYKWYSNNAGKGKTYGRQFLTTQSNIYAVSSINEATWDEIATDAKTASGYNTAIFVLSRIAGEGSDVQNKILEGNGSFTGYDALNGDYLTLSTEEKDVFEHLKQEKKKGTFDKIIVLMNMTNQVACGFVDEYDVDAVLYCGSLGSKGAVGVGNILAGKVNPSGKLSDTFWKDHYLNPVHANWGAYTLKDGYYMWQYVGYIYDNADNQGDYWNSYVVYQEGIYSGYRYTETRYEDTVLNKANVGSYTYTDNVSYPFGYGLSYTKFEYSDLSAVYNQETDNYDISVKVTNVGEVAGKESAQIFLQKPYTEYDVVNGVETASVELVAYEKTEILEPGKSEVLNMTVARRELAKYDSYGEGTYILEKGNYYLTVANGAHEAVNNILAKKKALGGVTLNEEAMVDHKGVTVTGTAGLCALIGNEIDELDFKRYSVSANGTAITNQFDDVDIKKFDPSQYGTNWQYVTRNDWNGTVKLGFDVETRSPLKNYVRLTRTAKIDAAMNYGEVTDPIDNDTPWPTMGSTATSWSLIDLRVDDDGNPIAYDDEKWEQLLNQLTWSEISAFLSDGSCKTQAIPSISKPETIDYDSDVGPIWQYSWQNGLAVQLADPDRDEYPATYLDSGIVAATRNDELLYEYGQQWGEDCMWAGWSGLYGTGADMHRSPYCGRNYGYYSEDPVLSGYTIAQVNLGMESKGAYMLLKHCVLNEQETNRCGGSSWANEQTIREVNLKTFQIAIEKGSVQGVMTSLNRLGATPAPHHSFLNNVLRGEFGMTGYCVTDSYFTQYMDLEYCVLAGNDLPLSGADSALIDIKPGQAGKGHIAQAARECVHRILYSVVQSNAMNGYSTNTRIFKWQPEWEYFLDGATEIVNVWIWPVVIFYVLVEAFIIVDGVMAKKGKKFYFIGADAAD